MNLFQESMRNITEREKTPRENYLSRPTDLTEDENVEKLDLGKRKIPKITFIGKDGKEIMSHHATESSPEEEKESGDE